MKNRRNRITSKLGGTEAEGEEWKRGQKGRKRTMKPEGRSKVKVDDKMKEEEEEELEVKGGEKGEEK